MKLYRCDTANFTKEEYLLAISDMQDGVREHIEKKKNFSDRVLSLCAYRLVLDGVKELFGASDAKIAFDGARPYFENLPIYFSISHSGTRVVAAVSARPVGVDIERRREIKRGMSKRFFTENEQKCDFFEIWTKKEAYGKCKGGLSEVLSTDVTELEFYTEDDGEYTIAVYEE